MGDSPRSRPRLHASFPFNEPLRTMIRQSIRLFATSAAAVLACAGAPGIAAQQPPGFSLPTPTPTPTPAPEGPADERAGVAIPPRMAPAPSPTAATTSPLPTPAAAPTSRPLALPSPSARSTARPAPPVADIAPTATPAPDTPPAPLTEPAPAASAPTAPVAAPPVVAETPAAPASALPDWWPWAAGGLGGLAVMICAAALWRQRKPRPLRLAPPAPEDAVPELPRLDITLDVISATRSLMMFTLAYRINLANRTDRAVNDLSLAVQLASARRGASNAPSSGAAQQVLALARIGPHQSRSVSGEIKLPLAEIAILRQGSAALFIPLLHVTLEGEGQQALTRSFVIGTPSTSGAARLHPILLDNTPGSIPGLRAQAVDVPPVSATA